MSHERKEYTYIDLFSGCGGLALGMHFAGWNAHFAVEKNQDAFGTLKFNLIEKRQHFCWPDWLPEGTHDINELIASYEAELKHNFALKLKDAHKFFFVSRICEQKTS